MYVCGYGFLSTKWYETEEVFSLNQLSHSANEKSKPDGYNGQNNNYQDAYHKVVIPEQSYNLEDTNYEEPD